jgi:organic radical activating enzyme
MSTEKNTEVTLRLRNLCNYSCEYCNGRGVHLDTVLHDMEKLSKIYQHINPFVLTVLECGTGEPTLHPQIKDILSLCCKYGTVSMPTNNSIDPKNWLLKEFARSIFLNITVHPQAEKELDQFLERLIKIKELGSTISLRYIARPDRLESFLSLKEYFDTRGFNLIGIPFVGVYKEKEYPYNYSVEEKGHFGLAESAYWVHRIQMDIKDRNFEGIPCLAGYSLFCISPESELTRCLYDETIMEVPYEDARPCIMPYCGCYLMFKELNTQTSNYWNSVRVLSGYPPLKDGDTSDDDLYQKAYRTYNDLIKRYKKQIN